MRNIFLAIFTLVCIMYTGTAQDFQGKAIYETKITGTQDFGGRDMPEARKKEIMERMKSAMEKTYILTFNRTESYYVEDEKLEAPGGGGPGWLRFMSGGSTGKYYKNIKNQTYTNQIEMYSKNFLIKDELKKPDWKMGSETKKIGNYTAYKATLTTPIDTTGMGAMSKMFRRGGNDANRTERKIPTEKTVIAWYTLDIPISQGPAEYWGLPGLILEVEQEKSTLICSKIIMNAEDVVEVKAPEKGKDINQADFDALMLKKRQEMMQNFQQRGRGGRGR
ncbi:GLPGLI family protein [Cellulophaga sp. 20_2_10]|uniref:GLPGLI family protein n=1 Tax=Cellulophaga sp. 20_2_10 TaxID=2942476 RepID=UPI00201B0FE5|nr:GLPGLI family protein [Cellulophaga sp. 20_2_10]MCL5245825.1 GLPGLI family protein [Cellulophaga sp. 20_2_10]